MAVKKISAKARISIERRRMAWSVSQPASGIATIATASATVLIASASPLSMAPNLLAKVGRNTSVR